MTDEPVAFGDPYDPRQWVRCANLIADLIAGGTLKPGDWLPPVKRISAELHIGFPAVKQALVELHGKGLISEVPNAGYYVGVGDPPVTRRSRENLVPTGPPQPPEQQSRKHRTRPREKPPDARSSLLAVEQYITAQELATLLRVSVMTVYRAIRSGEIAGVIQLNTRTIRIPVSGAKAYIENNHIEGHQLDPVMKEDDDAVEG